MKYLPKEDIYYIDAENATLELLQKEIDKLLSEIKKARSYFKSLKGFKRWFRALKFISYVIMVLDRIEVLETERNKLLTEDMVIHKLYEEEL